MKHVDTIIFDLDGTLLDTLEDLMDAVNVALQKERLPLKSLSEIRAIVGNGIRNLTDRSVPADTPMEVKDRVFENFRAYYKDHCKIKTKPYDGIREMLSVLSEKGYRMTIVSNKTDPAVQDLLQAHFYPAIQSAYGERENIPRKPKPDIVYLAMQELGAAKEQSVYIGDSEVDYQTAKNAGIRLVMVSWGFRDRAVLEALGADAIADTPEELVQIIEAL